MFKAEYHRNYSMIEVAEELPESGVLTGKEGDVRFQRCDDGVIICEAPWPGSGFVSHAVSCNFWVPDSINGIPITEVHQTIKICNSNPIAVEGKQLKRIYLDVSEMTFENQTKYDIVQFMLMKFGVEAANDQQKDSMEIAVDLYTQVPVDKCVISCNKECILHCNIKAKALEVHAPCAVLKGAFNGIVEHVAFDGKVYPFTCADWEGDYINYRCFERLKSLQGIKGTLGGNICWSFQGCEALKQVHLANGIKKIPAYAFQGCTSLEDLYIPDTVTEIEAYAFADCINLKKIHIPENISKISEGMFKNCRSLGKCFLPDQIKIIGDEAFRGCTSLKKPWIPKEIREISTTAFDDSSWGEF